MKLADNLIPKIIESSPYIGLLHSRMDGKVTQAKFDYELACGAAGKGGRDEMVFDSFPMMPEDLREFLFKWGKKFGIQKDRLQQRLYQEPSIVKYFETYYTL